VWDDFSVGANAPLTGSGASVVGPPSWSVNGSLIESFERLDALLEFVDEFPTDRSASCGLSLS
jgi:hypothetical protein